MFVKKSEIEEAIQSKIQEYNEWVSRKKNKNQLIVINNMVGCVVVQQGSPRKWYVMFRFTKQGTPVGTIQQDYHTSYNPNQEIVWVA